MANLPAIVRATRASAKALESMSRLARLAHDSTHGITLNRRAMAAGRMSRVESEALNATLRIVRDKARKDWRKAYKRHLAAQAVLEANPI
jgi:hypothetical protein